MKIYVRVRHILAWSFLRGGPKGGQINKPHRKKPSTKAAEGRGVWGEAKSRCRRRETPLSGDIISSIVAGNYLAILSGLFDVVV